MTGMLDGFNAAMNRSLAFWTDPAVREAAVQRAGALDEAAVLESIRAGFGNAPQREHLSQVDITVAEAFGRLTPAQAAEARARLVNLSESTAMLARSRVMLRESTTVTPTKVSARRLRVTIISPGVGTSGAYPASTLEAAARDKVFPKGTQMFLNHQTAREQAERPEGSVRDLAAVLAEDARWTGSALVAEADVLPTHADLVAALENVAGVSIRGQGEVEVGTFEGQRTRVVTRLVPPAQSVDFVTKAGRGGRYEVLESERPRWV